MADAEKQIADLERRLALRKQNSTNSSKPPSSDGLAGELRQRGRRKKSRRKVGGQPGHRGAHQPLVPLTQVDKIRPVLPEQCRRCGHALPRNSIMCRQPGNRSRQWGKSTVAASLVVHRLVFGRAGRRHPRHRPLPPPVRRLLAKGRVRLQARREADHDDLVMAVALTSWYPAR